MISFKMKSLFFDRAAVINAVDKASRKVLSKIGSMVRQTARESIRNAPKTYKVVESGRNRRKQYKRRPCAKPGKPPFNKSGLLKRFLFFAYDPAANSVVIGPAKLSGRISETALPALEYGGESTAKKFEYYGSNSRRSKVFRKVNIRPHPFMGPALEQEQSKLPGLWADSVHN